MKKHITLFIAGIFYSAIVFGWGHTGHRIVGEIAQKNLTKKTQIAIAYLLNNRDLAYLSTYMDDVKSDDSFDHTHDWHWVTIKNGSTYSQMEKNKNGDAVEAINRMIEILKNNTESVEKQQEALAFLVHLIGDIHQPLHVGKGDDKGGNDVKVKWFGKPSNLHRVWDSEMIESKGWSYTELANIIQADALKVKSTVQQGNALDWVHEAMQYREVIYEIENPEKMGYHYMYKNWHLVEQQLLKAGLRLAYVLNTIYG